MNEIGKDTGHAVRARIDHSDVDATGYVQLAAVSNAHIEALAIGAAGQVQTGDGVDVRLVDGVVGCRVERIRPIGG